MDTPLVCVPPPGLAWRVGSRPRVLLRDSLLQLLLSLLLLVLCRCSYRCSGAAAVGVVCVSHASLLSGWCILLSLGNHLALASPPPRLQATPPAPPAFVLLLLVGRPEGGGCPPSCPDTSCSAAGRFPLLSRRADAAQGAEKSEWQVPLR